MVKGSIGDAIMNVVWSVVSTIGYIIYYPFNYVMQLHPYIKTALIGFAILLCIIIIIYIIINRDEIFNVMLT